jgi:hypothetical protein
MNKILIIVYVPLIELKYEIYIPINKKIGTVKDLIVKSINEMSDNSLNTNRALKLYNNDTGDVLPNNIYVKDSNMVNGTTLVLI